MSLNAINDPVPTPARRSGGKGGLWGSIVGGVAGVGSLAAAPFTGGTSLAALPAVLGGVSAAAPVVGNLIDPAKVSGGEGQASAVPLVQGPKAKMSVMAQDPNVQLATIANAKSLIPQSRMSQSDAEEAMSLLNGAQSKLQYRLGG